MFGQNKRLAPKDFADLAEFKVTSMFFTLQGEGPFSGHRAVFIRLAHCNLTCSFCDTYFDDGDFLALRDIASRVQVLQHANADADADHTPVLVVITGGEPLMQPNLKVLLDLLHQNGHSTQIESNGNFYQTLPAITHLVVSPKINEAVAHQPTYVKVDPRTLERADTLKFVISATMSGYTHLPDWAFEWRDGNRHRRIYVTPMNVYARQPVKLGPGGTLAQRSEQDERISFWTPGLLDMAALQANYERAAEIALGTGAILSLQTHLFASLP
jgi:7-carboxy-7-deazaguanine synthase